MPELKMMTFLALSCATLNSIASGTLASSHDRAETDQTVTSQLEVMRQQLEAIRQENQAMKSEIDDLRAKTDADWLTEARANEIRGLVADVLADADSRASLLQDGMMAGWSEHFFLADPYGRFKLELEGMMQFRWIYSYLERPVIFNPFNPGDRDQHREGFENTRTRLTFNGFVFSPDIEYLIRGDFARAGGNFGLLDAWIRYHFNDAWSLRFGQFKLPFNREELVLPSAQLAVERSLVNETFNVGRSQGIELTIAGDTSRLMLATSDGGSGPVGGPGSRMNQGALAIDTEYSVTTRYEHLFSGTWDQFQDFTSPPGDSTGMLWGIGGHFEESESGAPAFTQSTTRIVAATTDLSFEWGGASAFTAASFTYVDFPPSGNQPFSGMFHFIGLMGQVAVYVAPKWEIFARGEYMNFEFGSGALGALSDIGIATAGFNYYIEGHDLKWTTDISVGLTDIGVTGLEPLGFRANADETWPQVVFRTQFQLLF